MSASSENASRRLVELNALLAPYKVPSVPLALKQLADTFIPYAATLVLAHWTAQRGEWLLSIPCMLIAAGLLMRVFIIQHDCGHGSFFKSQRANDALGAVIGLLTLAPYSYWKQTHAIHHATSGNLDKRGWGDIDTRTVAEYRAMTPRQRFFYRVYRSAPVLFLFGPTFHFLVYHRFPGIVPADWTAERRSILLNDLVLAAILWAAARSLGLWSFLGVQLAVGAMAACAGVWFFYVQHQYEGTYWRRDGEWDFAEASLRGSSYYDLPALLRWMTGNIGFHHIHHLSSRVPNYRLRKCMEENAEFRDCERLTFFASFSCAKLTLWDEERGRLVRFDEVPA